MRIHSCHRCMGVRKVNGQARLCEQEWAEIEERYRRVAEAMIRNNMTPLMRKPITFVVPAKDGNG